MDLKLLTANQHRPEGWFLLKRIFRAESLCAEIRLSLPSLPVLVCSSLGFSLFGGLLAYLLAGWHLPRVQDFWLAFRAPWPGTCSFETLI